MSTERTFTTQQKVAIATALKDAWTQAQTRNSKRGFTVQEVQKLTPDVIAEGYDHSDGKSWFGADNRKTAHGDPGIYYIDYNWGVTSITLQPKFGIFSGAKPNCLTVEFDPAASKGYKVSSYGDIPHFNTIDVIEDALSAYEQGLDIPESGM